MARNIKGAAQVRGVIRAIAVLQTTDDVQKDLNQAIDWVALQRCCLMLQSSLRTNESNIK